MKKRVESPYFNRTKLELKLVKDGYAIQCLRYHIDSHTLSSIIFRIIRNYFYYESKSPSIKLPYYQLICFIVSKIFHHPAKCNLDFVSEAINKI